MNTNFPTNNSFGGLTSAGIGLNTHEEENVNAISHPISTGNQPVTVEDVTGTDDQHRSLHPWVLPLPNAASDTDSGSEDEGGIWRSVCSVSPGSSSKSSRSPSTASTTAEVTTHSSSSIESENSQNNSTPENELSSRGDSPSPESAIERNTEPTQGAQRISNANDLPLHRSAIQGSRVQNSSVDDDWLAIDSNGDGISATSNIGTLQKSYELLNETLFDPGAVLKLRDVVRLQCEARKEIKTSIESSQASEVAAPDQPSIQALEREINHLQLKEAALTQYLRSNPFNDKNVLRPRRNLVEGTFLHITVVIDRMHEHLGSLSNGEQTKEVLAESTALKQALLRVEKSFKTWHENELNVYECADPERCSHAPDFYTNTSKKTEENPISRYNDSCFAATFQNFFRDAGIPKRFVELVTPQAIQVATAKVMNEI